MTVNLQGVRLRHWLAPAGLKRLMSRSLAYRNLVSYEIVEPPSDAPPIVGKPVEKRSSARRRLRLRSGKLLDAQNKFLCECLVRNRSGQGLCLMLAKNVGLPIRYRLYDDETGSLNAVTTIWRRNALLGVRYCLNSKPVAIRESDRSALRGRYYAVLD
jgi:hypothetical protein